MTTKKELDYGHSCKLDLLHKREIILLSYNLKLQNSIGQALSSDSAPAGRGRASANFLGAQLRRNNPDILQKSPKCD